MVKWREVRFILLYKSLHLVIIILNCSHFLVSIDAFSFVIGASCWESGQLESEINKGYWLPCSAPPIITLTGRSEDDKGDIKSNLWLSMMCSLGNHEARLANLLENEVRSEDGNACDDGRH